MTKERIAELRALCDRAELAPWGLRGNEDSTGVDVVSGDVRVAWCPDRFDAEFVAASRKAMWELLDEVERLTTRVASLRSRSVVAERKLREATCSSA